MFPPKTKIGSQVDVKTKVALSVGMVAALLVGAFFVKMSFNIMLPLMTGGATCNSSYKLGDVDKSGIVEYADYKLVYNILLGQSSFSIFPCADLNFDGKVSANDLMAVYSVFIKLPVFSGYWPLSTITSISPISGPIGTVVTVRGANFGTSNAILFDNGAAGQITGVSSTGSILTFTIASTATARAYAVSVKNTANNNITNARTFTVTPSIIATTTTSTIPVGNCVETDGGENYNVKATTTSSLNGSYEDYCFPAAGSVYYARSLSGKGLKEFYCGADKLVKERNYEGCLNGCYNGACSAPLVKTCNSSVALGNVNPDQDSLINATDVELVTNVYWGRASLADYPCADLNNDGKVNATEITLMPICAKGGSACVGKYWPAQ